MAADPVIDADPPAATDLRGVVGDQPYALLDGPGRAALLDRLTSFMVALDRPGQLWHGPDPVAPVRGVGAAAALTRELAASAVARRTVFVAPTARASGYRPPTPTGERRRQVVLDDSRVGRVLALTGWPPAVTPGWLGELAARCDSVTMHLRPLAGDLAARLLRRRLASLTSSEAVDEQAGRIGDPALHIAADAARDLRHAVARGTTQLLHAQVLLTITAADDDGLEKREQHLQQLARGLLAGLTCLTFEQRPGWTAAQPGSPPLGAPWRLLDATSAAAAVPLPVGPGPAAAAGTLVGVDPASGVPVCVDRFAAHNPNRLVVGTSGAGKSYAAKLELVRQLAGGTRAVVVDPEGEFGRVAESIGGLCLTVGEEPAGLDPVGLASRPSLSAAEGLSVLTAWATALLGAPLGPVDLALLDRALGVVRADHLVQPTAADLLAVVGDLAAHPPFRGADLPARLAPATGGAMGELFAPNPDLADPPDLVAFDLRGVPDRARPAVMACVLTWAWCETIAAGAGRPCLVVVDEAHLLLDDPAAAELLVQFARRARKYGVGLDVVTQRLSDFLRHPAGEVVLANAATKLLLGCEDHERAAVAAGLGLSPAEAELLRPGRRGRGLLLFPGLRTAIEVVAAPAEHILASAGPR